jgi:hypothetical protein
VDYFEEGKMIKIKVQNLKNFNVEPLENFDEQMIYDFDFEKLLEKGNVLG